MRHARSWKGNNNSPKVHYGSYDCVDLTSFLTCAPSYYMYSTSLTSLTFFTLSHGWRKVDGYVGLKSVDKALFLGAWVV